MHWSIVTANKSAIMFHGTRQDVKVRWPVLIYACAYDDATDCFQDHIREAKHCASYTVKPHRFA